MLKQVLGAWRGRVPIPDRNLNALEPRLEGQEEELFLNFFRKMLQWEPENKSDIRDILVDEWLLADLIETGEVVREE